jgi:hypothetical protein
MLLSNEGLANCERFEDVINPRGSVRVGADVAGGFVSKAAVKTCLQGLEEWKTTETHVRPVYVDVLRHGYRFHDGSMALTLEAFWGQWDVA